MITKEMTIADIFENFPQKSQKLAQELTRHGLQCVGCSAATWETLEVGVLSHGKTTQDLENLVIALNNILEGKLDDSTIAITEAAAEKFRKVLAEENKESWALAIEKRATIFDIANCSHAHPTLAEAIKEAAVSIAKKAIHI